MEEKNSAINTFVLAGNRLIREALARVLKSKSDICVGGAAPFSREALEELGEAGASVALVDPVSSDPSDFSFVEEATRMAPRARVVLIDMADDETAFLNAVRAGAVGYVLQSASALDIVTAVRSVWQGEAVCPAHLCLALFRHLAKSGLEFPRKPRCAANLTRREQQLVPLIAQGYTNKEIACSLNLSEQTVKNHVHRILQRVGASGRLEVAQIMQD